MDDSTLTIGEVAKRSGLNVSAIRYYEAEPKANPRIPSFKRSPSASCLRSRS
jgi:hypothetical protein